MSTANITPYYVFLLYRREVLTVPEMYDVGMAQSQGINPLDATVHSNWFN